MFMEDPEKHMQEAVMVDAYLGAEDIEQDKMEVVEGCDNDNLIDVAADHESSSRPLKIHLHVSMATPPAQAKPVKLGKMFLPFAVQASLSLLTISLASGSFSSSSSTEAKKLLLQVAGVCNLIGYIGCLADVLLRQANKEMAQAAGTIGATASVFGFTATMVTLLAQSFWAAIGIAALVAMLFFIAVISKIAL